MKIIATATEVRDTFLVADIDKTLEEIADVIIESMDYDTSADLLLSILEALHRRDAGTKSILDKMVKTTRLAYICGYLESARDNFTAAKMGYNELFGARRAYPLQAVTKPCRV